MCENATTLTVALQTGQTATIDDTDKDLLQYKWYIGGTKRYAQRIILKPKRTSRSMHREIMGRILDRPLTKADEVDHIDGNPLNNCRANLRLAPHQMNLGNTKRYKSNKSGYKGVSLVRYNGKWEASIQVNRKTRHLGKFDTPEEAHEAYKRAAIEIFGEFARFE